VSRGHDFVRQGAGPWHKPAAPCAPPRPDHFYHLDPSAGADALPAIGRACPDCFPGRER
jgi:hypothetical protein